MAGQRTLGQPTLRALCSQPRYLASSGRFKRKIIQQAMTFFWLHTMLGLFVCFWSLSLLISTSTTIGQGRESENHTHWYWSTKLVIVLSSLLPHLCGLSLSVTVQLCYFRAQIPIGKTEEAMAAADTGLHLWRAGHRKKPGDGIEWLRSSHLLLERKHLPYQESCVAKSWNIC